MRDMPDAQAASLYHKLKLYLVARSSYGVDTVRWAGVPPKAPPHEIEWKRITYAQFLKFYQINPIMEH